MVKLARGKPGSRRAPVGKDRPSDLVAAGSGCSPFPFGSATSEGWSSPSRCASASSASALETPTFRLSDRWCLPERERIRLGAGLEEHDLKRPLANRVVLSHELVEAALPEQAVPVLVDVHAV